MSGRQRRYRERNASAGLVEVTVIVPADRADELRAFAAQLRAGRAPRAARRPPADPAQLGLLGDDPSPDRPAPEAPPRESAAAARPARQGRPAAGTP